MHKNQDIWTTYLVVLAIANTPGLIYIIGHVIERGLTPSRILLILLTVLIILALPIRKKIPPKPLGFFLVTNQLLVILIGVTQSGVFSPSIPAFVSLPIVVAGIWGLFASLSVLAIGLISFACIAYLTGTGALTVPDITQLDNWQMRLWVSNIVAAGISGTIGLVVASKLRKNWRASLREVDAQYAETQSILDNLIDAYFRCDTQDRIIRASPSFYKLTGLDAEAERTEQLVDVFGDNAELELFFLRLKSKEKARTAQLSTIFKQPSGETTNIDIRAIRLEDSKGKFSGYEGIIHDRTDLVESETGRQVAEVQKSSVAENIPGAVYDYILYPDGTETVEFLNANCEAIWGVTAEEAAKNPDVLREKILKEDLAAIRALVGNSTNDRLPWGTICRVANKVGEIRHLNIRALPHHYPDESLRWHFVALDVTEQVEAQEELTKQIALTEQSQKRETIGQLTGGVAHDFNNLLAIIMGNLELLEGEDEEDERQKLIETALGATLRGADLTKNMLAFARRTRLQPKTLDLNTIVRRTKNWSGRTLPANIAVETSLLAGLWKVEADESSIESALLNLIVNARDAMPDGGKLTIESANVRIDADYLDDRSEEFEPGRYVMLAVSDTGTGISPEHLNKIFDPFFTTKQPGSGSGLGLSMIEGFTRQSGGGARVYSELGIGTTFKLYFKALTKGTAKKEPPQRSVTTSQHNNATVFVVEDEPSVRKILIKNLEKNGYNVRSAASGDLALRYFEADSDVDILVTDIVMAGQLQGTDLAKEIRKIRPDLPIVFMSGYASEATVHGNGLRPEDIRLMKPVRSADLLAALEKALLE